ncbi:F-box protein [Spatholobus suberectus]|nr:F-box protein [Spatholobus suberectus]
MTMALSHDELFQIFSQLPAKAIYKFTSTSKFFSKFPKETYFASKQTQNALLRDDTCFFIQTEIIAPWYSGQIELHPLPGEELSSGVSNDVLRLLSKSAHILSSSNGLILCRAMSQEQVKLFICNPATQSWLPIPAPKHLQKSIDVNFVGFECDSDDFMVFLFCDNSDDWSSYVDCNVYLSKEDVWKAREENFFTGERNLKFDRPVHHNGAIYFISDCAPYLKKNSPYFRPYIMSYNFEDGKSRMLRVPKEARKGSHDRSCDMRIFKWGKATNSNQSICLVRLRKHVFTVWVLTKYESSLWRRVLKVRVKAMGLLEKDPVVKGFAVLNGDFLVFATKNKVYGYGLIDMRIQEIREHGCESNVLRFTSYSNTLRTCGTGVGTLPLSSYMWNC